MSQKTEPTPLTKLMNRLAPIVEDIVAGRNSVAVAKDYDLHGCTVAFIRKAIGIKRKGTRKVSEERIEAVMEYSLNHSISETAEMFGICKSTVSNYIRRACGGQR